ARQHQADREAQGVLERARRLLKEGWEAHDLVRLLAKLEEAKSEGNRAMAIARNGTASGAVQQQIVAFRTQAEEWLRRAQKSHALSVALLDVRASQQIRTYSNAESGRMETLGLPRSVDEQYTTAFRDWGLDVDGTAEAEVVARLREEPESVMQQ